MYFATIILLLFLFPDMCVSAEAFHQGLTPLLAGKWLCFWAVGVRLFIAGVRQISQPAFTAREIFNLAGDSAFPIVRELGFANLSMGSAGLCVLARPDWLLAASLVGGLYYGLAGAGHIAAKHRNAKENLAMLSDLWVFAILAIFIFKSLR